MDLLASFSTAVSSVATNIHQRWLAAKDSVKDTAVAAKDTVIAGFVEVLEHVSPKKRRRSSSASTSPSVSVPFENDVSAHPPPPLLHQPQAKRPRLADPVSDSQHFPSPFLPPRVPLPSETPPRSRTPESRSDPRIEAAVTHGLASTPRPRYPSTPARYRSHLPALDVRQQFFRRSYAALGPRRYASEPSSPTTTKRTAKTIPPTSVRKSVFKRRFRNPQRLFVSPKVLARNTRLYSLQSHASPRPYRSPKSSPELPSRSQARTPEVFIENDRLSKSLPKAEAPESIPSPSTRAEQLSKLPPAIASLLRSDSRLSDKLWKEHKQRIHRLSLSDQNMRYLEIEHFVKCQELDTIRRGQEQARRMASLRPELRQPAQKAPQKPQPEEPPRRASHFYESQYWLPPDEDWYEETNDVRERDSSITVTDPNSAFAPLTKSAVARLRATLADASNQNSELSRVDGCVIRGEDLRTLRPNNWLNDEIVNAYMTLIAERAMLARKSKSDENAKPNGHPNSFANGNGLRHSYESKIALHSRQHVPKVKVISSFFYSTLFKFNPRTRTTEYNYSRVKRWTRRFDVFEYDLMLIPINQQNLHWTLGVVNFKDKVVAHLDSMGKGGSPEVRENLFRWVRDEAATKGHEFNSEEWSADDVIVPQQTNSDDCGVFLCKYADFLTRGWSDFTFSQDHMNYFRARMAHELLMKKA
ncbi:Ulp1 peptidase [Gracilaria domingensis]|nr:Ulp1 peptidase [Gracilaria domingensis]